MKCRSQSATRGTGQYLSFLYRSRTTTVTVMATPSGTSEKTGVAEVRLEHSDGHHHHHKEINVLPLEQEAVQDAVHIQLTWRSWVWRRTHSKGIAKPLTLLLRLAGGVHNLLRVSPPIISPFETPRILTRATAWQHKCSWWWQQAP